MPTDRAVRGTATFSRSFRWADPIAGFADEWLEQALFIVERADGQAVLAVAGEVDLANVDEFRRHPRCPLRPGPR